MAEDGYAGKEWEREEGRREGETERERDCINGRVCFNLVIYMQLTGSIGRV